MDYISYYNDMLAGLEETMYHELSGISSMKVELIGTDYIRSKNIKGKTADEVIENCIKEIKAAGIAQDISYSIHGFGILLKLNIKGCIHLSMETKLMRDGIVPYMCPVANMILDQIIEKLNYENALVINNLGIPTTVIDAERKECVVKCALYETIDKIGQVSDWTKIP